MCNLPGHLGVSPLLQKSQAWCTCWSLLNRSNASVHSLPTYTAIAAAWPFGSFGFARTWLALIAIASASRPVHHTFVIAPFGSCPPFVTETVDSRTHQSSTAIAIAAPDPSRPSVALAVAPLLRLPFLVVALLAGVDQMVVLGIQLRSLAVVDLLRRSYLYTQKYIF